MPALASHRKPRSRTTRTFGTSSPAVGVTTAAIASVTTLLSAQSAGAAPGRPSVEEVERKVDDLYRQAGTATQQYNKAQEAGEQQRTGEDVLDEAAKRTRALNESRRVLGAYAAAQSRSGGAGPSAALLLTDAPQPFADRARLTGRTAEQRREQVTELRTQQADAAGQRAETNERRAAATGQPAETTRSPEALPDSQASLQAGKEAVQRKLAEARALLARLTAEERARLERGRGADARHPAEGKACAAVEAAREHQEQEHQEHQDPRPAQGEPGWTGGAGAADSGYTAKADKVLAFARAQIGKPYVWGATGPSSYDCSGLTQAAWKAAGVDLPRTTWEQVEAGTPVALEDLRPGDLVFFYDDISHVGIYLGDGMMIHAPEPGANVREESIYYLPVHGSVRPA
ncbi:C40 family peptidase [Streptomyces sp. NRRL S-118]|uniref:C40 family peptidase n=1 Tax=Streptomyces sp. NRRL S-118 TaxID=1463881 RepID=UPI0004CAABC6|nr:C40 family peptidase [Streptomyces sp. NRRL S-118]